MNKELEEDKKVFEYGIRQMLDEMEWIDSIRRYT